MYYYRHLSAWPTLCKLKTKGNFVLGKTFSYLGIFKFVALFIGCQDDLLFNTQFNSIDSSHESISLDKSYMQNASSNLDWNNNESISFNNQAQIHFEIESEENNSYELKVQPSAFSGSVNVLAKIDDQIIESQIDENNHSVGIIEIPAGSKTLSLEMDGTGLVEFDNIKLQRSVSSSSGAIVKSASNCDNNNLIKPISESDSNLVILVACQYKGKITSYNFSGNASISRHHDDGANGNRSHYFFNKPGSQVSGTFSIRLNDGRTLSYSGSYGNRIDNFSFNGNSGQSPNLPNAGKEQNFSSGERCHNSQNGRRGFRDSSGTCQTAYGTGKYYDANWNLVSEGSSNPPAANNNNHSSNSGERCHNSQNGRRGIKDSNGVCQTAYGTGKHYDENWNLVSENSASNNNQSSSSGNQCWSGDRRGILSSSGTCQTGLSASGELYYYDENWTKRTR